MSHPFQSWYEFGGVTEQERQQEVSDSDFDLGDYLVEGWGEDWEEDFWDEGDKEKVGEHPEVGSKKNVQSEIGEPPEVRSEEQVVPMEMENALEPNPLTTSASSDLPVRRSSRSGPPLPVVSDQKLDYLELEQTRTPPEEQSTTLKHPRDISNELSEEDDEMPSRLLKKRKEISVEDLGDDNESDLDSMPLPARGRRHLARLAKTPAAPRSKQKLSRVDSKLGFSADESDSAKGLSDSDSDAGFIPSPPKPVSKVGVASRSKARKNLASSGNNPQSGPYAASSLEARRTILKVKVRSREQKDTILQQPKEERPNFNWDYLHYLALAILEHHFGLERKAPQALCKRKAGAQDWVAAIYNTYGAKDRSGKAHRWDLVQAALEAPEGAKSDEYKEIRRKVFDAVAQLGIRSRLPPGQMKPVDFEKID